jgi:formylglycine-generating enzyme required for sulfatase activity
MCVLTAACSSSDPEPILDGDSDGALEDVAVDRRAADGGRVSDGRSDLAVVSDALADDGDASADHPPDMTHGSEDGEASATGPDGDRSDAAADGAPSADATGADTESDAALDGRDEGVDSPAPEASADAGTETGGDGAADAADVDDDDGGGVFDNPSCTNLAPGCGPTRRQSCCRRAPIPGGFYYRSFDGVSATNVAYPATVGPFVLDTFEVTVGRFRSFVANGFGTQANPPAAGRGAVPGAPASGWSSSDNGRLAPNAAALEAGLKCSPTFQTWTDAPSSSEDQPINCVTWYEAFAFCVWDGGRLATESEWNYAAAGGSEQRVYPWSSPPAATSISEANASYWMDPSKRCYGDGVSGCSLGDLVVAGSKPAGRGRWGHADLGGNVWEWVRDTFSNPYANVSCTNCVEASNDPMKVIRGGSFYGTSSTLLAAGRSEGVASTRYYTVGIRCAR